jgi:fibronectin type 3 domain-containing protein
MEKTKKIIALLISLIMLLGSFPISAYAAVKAPSKPTSVSASSTDSTVTVKWKKVSGATGYTIYSYNSSNKKYTKVVSTKNVSYKISKLKAGTTYVYAVKAYKTVNKKNYYSSYSSKVTISTLLSKVTGLKRTASKTDSISLSWSKANGATGYTVYSYNTSSKKYTKLIILNLAQHTFILLRLTEQLIKKHIIQQIIRQN